MYVIVFFMSCRMLVQSNKPSCSIPFRTVCISSNISFSSEKYLYMVSLAHQQSNSAVCASWLSVSDAIVFKVVSSVCSSPFKRAVSCFVRNLSTILNTRLLRYSTSTATFLCTFASVPHIPFADKPHQHEVRPQSSTVQAVCRCLCL